MTDTPTDFDLNEYERRMARIHATAYEGLHAETMQILGKAVAASTQARVDALWALASQSMILAGEYRRIANSGKAGT